LTGRLHVRLAWRFDPGLTCVEISQ
jgi:hypothetical protein